MGGTQGVDSVETQQEFRPGSQSAHLMLRFVPQSLIAAGSLVGTVRVDVKVVV